ncbi:TetR-like C-terminal domain-containing protein [Cellulomonas hominis]
MIALLTTANESRSRMMAIFSAELGTYFQATGPTPADLRRDLLGGRPSSMTDIMRRAVERGEADPARPSPRVVSLTFDLFRREALMTFRPVPAETIREIVDDVYLPLVGRRGPIRGGAGTPGAGGPDARTREGAPTAGWHPQALTVAGVSAAVASARTQGSRSRHRRCPDGTSRGRAR